MSRTPQKDPLREDPLSALLRQLPRPTARPGFTTQVLHRLEEPPSPRRALRWGLAAAAAGVVLLLGLLLPGGPGDRPGQRPGLAGAGTAREAPAAPSEEHRREELRRERRAIARELAALKEELAREEPVLYLGGNEQFELVLGADDFGGPARPAAEAASYRP
jgi:hypothetical protein